MKARNGLLGAAAALLATTASGEELQLLAQLDEDPFFKELPVVLSVSRLAQPLHDAPGSVTVIDADAIRTSGARDLADLLRLVPGFLVAHSHLGAPNAVYHGMTSENPRGLQILIDGRSQYSPLFFGGIAWNLLDVSLDEVDRIEVIRGSNSAAYGSNAFLGVVNVITRRTAETQGVRVRVGEGNDGIQDRYARVGGRLGDGAFRLSTEITRDNGIKHYDDRRQNRRFNLRADLPLSAADELQVEAGGADMHLRSGLAGETTDPPRGIEAEKEFASLAWQRTTSTGGSVSLRFTHTSERYRDDYRIFDRNFDKALAAFGIAPYVLDIYQRVDTVRDELEFQHTVVPNETSRFVWGAGARHDSVEGEQFYGREGDPVWQKVHRLFGNFEWRATEDWTTNLGLTWENDSLSDTSLAPRAAVNYHLSPKHTLRAGISRAHRIPSLTEAKSREYYGKLDTTPITTRLRRPHLGVIPVDIGRDARGELKKEVNDVRELGYLGDFREQGAFLDVRLFEEKVQDVILPVSRSLTAPNCEVRALPGCGNYLDYINGQDLAIRGIEYQARWTPLRGMELALHQSFVSIDARGNSRFKTLAREPKDVTKANEHMENSSPGRSTGIRWVQRMPAGLELSVAHFRYGRYQWTPNTAVNPSQRTDVRIAYPFRVGTTRGEFALTGQGVDGRRVEFKERDSDGDSDVRAQYLQPRLWGSLTMQF